MRKIIKSVENLNSTSQISFSLFLFIVVYFVFHAFKFTPEVINELDSLGQHIPLAESILKGKLFSPPEMGSGLGYYMPIGEIILAIFIRIGMPLGLYNVAAILALFYLCYKLAKKLGLDNNLSVIYAFSISYLNSVTRLIPTQKNDLWLNVFFIWVLYLLTKPKKDYKFFLLLGISVGLLVGVKYSGILFAIILLGVYLINIRKHLNIKNMLVFSVPVISLGIVWFLRNYNITGNPFYPVNTLGFRGHPNFTVPQGYQNLLATRSIILTLEAFISEYLVWSIFPVLLLVAAIKHKVHKIKGVKQLLIIAGLSSVIYFLAPTEFTRVNITSNMRFLQPAFIALILASFMIAKKTGKEREIILISLLSSIMVLSQLSYYPKLIMVWLFAVTYLLVRNNVIRRSYK